MKKVVIGCAFLLLASASSALASGYHKRIIARGSELGSIDAVDFDQSGNLWVLSGTGSAIYKMHRTGVVLDKFTAADGVEFPPSLAVGPDNLVYFAEFFSGRIKRI